MTLVEDYQARMSGCLKEKKFYGGITVALYLIAFIASVAATIAAAAGPQHRWSDFLVIVKRKGEVGPALARESPMGTRLSFDSPADAQQRGKDSSRLGRRSVAHAA